MRVMIVDDEQPCLDELVYMLSKYSDIDIVGTYLNPYQALEALKSTMPDLVFLDIVMPFIDGVELAERIHVEDSTIRFVFVSAHVKLLASNQLILENGYILKPVSETKLGALLSIYRRSIEKVDKKLINNNFQ